MSNMITLIQAAHVWADHKWTADERSVLDANLNQV
jgi:hypothetical protein